MLGLRPNPPRRCSRQWLRPRQYTVCAPLVAFECALFSRCTAALLWLAATHPRPVLIKQNRTTGPGQLKKGHRPCFSAPNGERQLNTGGRPLRATAQAHRQGGTRSARRLKGGRGRRCDGAHGCGRPRQTASPSLPPPSVLVFSNGSTGTVLHARLRRWPEDAGRRAGRVRCTLYMHACRQADQTLPGLVAGRGASRRTCPQKGKPSVCPSYGIHGIPCTDYRAQLRASPVGIMFRKTSREKNSRRRLEREASRGNTRPASLVISGEPTKGMTVMQHGVAATWGQGRRGCF